MSDYIKAMNLATIERYQQQIERWTGKLFFLLSTGGEQAEIDFLEYRIQWRINELVKLEASI